MGGKQISRQDENPRSKVWFANPLEPANLNRPPIYPYISHSVITQYIFSHNRLLCYTRIISFCRRYWAPKNRSRTFSFSQGRVRGGAGIWGWFPGPWPQRDQKGARPSPKRDRTPQSGPYSEDLCSGGPCMEAQHSPWFPPSPFPPTLPYLLR